MKARSSGIACGVRLEPVPWARPGAQHTRDFEDVVAWLAQQMAFAPIARLLQLAALTERAPRGAADAPVDAEVPHLMMS